MIITLNINGQIEVCYLGIIFGVTRKTISGWENAYDNMPLPKMIRFANDYKYSLDYISGLSRKNKYTKLNKADPIKIGKKLKQVRTRLQLTQQQIADECMISQTTYSNYEQGLYLITSLSLYTICYNHSLSMDYFIK